MTTGQRNISLYYSNCILYWKWLMESRVIRDILGIELQAMPNDNHRIKLLHRGLLIDHNIRPSHHSLITSSLPFPITQLHKQPLFRFTFALTLAFYWLHISSSCVPFFTYKLKYLDFLIINPIWESAPHKKLFNWVWARLFA